eukprot:3101916-Pleurochrysis_carterae.AAC.1
MDEEVRLLNEQVAQLRRMSEQELRQLKDERATSDATKAHIDLVMRLELASLAEQARAAHTAQEIALERSQQLFDAEAEIAAMHQELLTRTDAMSKRTQLVQARLEADYRRQLRDMREECRQDAIDSINEESRQALYASRKLTKQVLCRKSRVSCSEFVLQVSQWHMAFSACAFEALMATSTVRMGVPVAGSEAPP